MLRSHTGNPLWQLPQFLIQNGSVVYEYRVGLGEVILGDFFAGVGDTVEIRHYATGDSSVVIVTEAGYEDIFGRIRYRQRY